MTKAEVSRLKCLRRNFELENWCQSSGEPVQVDIFIDDQSGKAFQVDWRRGKYREANAKTAAVYGDWNSLD